MVCYDKTFYLLIIKVKICKDIFNLFKNILFAIKNENMNYSIVQ